MEINLKNYNTFKVPAFAYNFIKLKNFKDLEKLSKNNKNKKTIILGGGSNILFTKKEYKEEIILYNQIKGIEKIKNNEFKVYSGENLMNFIKFLDRNNIKNLNPLFGIPGTVGGAIVGNAGSYGEEIGNYIKKIYVWNFETNKIEIFDYKYGYRYSNLKDKKKLLVIYAIFNFEKKNTNNGYLQPIEYIKKRANQPKGNTCGSFFKNFKVDKIEKLNIKNLSDKEIEKLNEFINKLGYIPTGWLIENIGMKGFDYGGVKISEKHGNFFINYGEVEGEKILKLANIVQDKVFEKFGIKLEPEVRIIN